MRRVRIDSASLAEKLLLPPEALGALRVTAVGKGSVLIENHRGVDQFDEDYLRVRAARGSFAVWGSGIRIRALGRFVSGRGSAFHGVGRMKKTLRLLRGEQRVRLSGGEKERFLNACAEAGVALWAIDCEPDAVTATLSEDDLPRARKIAVLTNTELEALALRGGSRSLGLLRRRAALGLIAAFCALALCVSSLFIWDFEVVGNEKLSRTTILHALAACGVREGCFWPASDAEAIRSGMLLRLPELAWMSLNVRGSRATVAVLERREKPELYAESRAADLIAARGGVIADYSVLNGKTLVSRGETVEEGRTLVSGEMESLSGEVRKVRALGRVTADTWVERTVVLCPAARRKEPEDGYLLILALRAGKVRVNLFGGGRKELDECDKIVKEYTAGIKGLFSFPLHLIAEVYRPYAPLGEYRADAVRYRERAFDALADEIDGEIISCDFSEEDGTLRFRAHCRENIAREKETDP